MNKKVTIICPVHGKFEQRPQEHLKGRYGCPKCALDAAGNATRSNTNDFIARAKKIHGDKYDYSKVEYVNANKKVCIICPEHGEFLQTPVSHLLGSGCPKCIGRNKTTEDFIREAREVHGNKYDYSKTVYVRANKKVCITCPEHGEFMMTPNAHLRGGGCPKCVHPNAIKDTEDFIVRAREVHGDKYDYSKVQYHGVDAKVCIICPEHGEFWQKPYDHIKLGNGCPKCCGLLKTTEDFIREARKVHGDKYDYSKVEYVNANRKVCIICPEHGEFFMSPTNHLQGKGCRSCNNSHLEDYMSEFLTKKNIFFEAEKKFEWLSYKNNMRIDFFLPEKKIAIECQGRQHFCPVDYFGGELGYIETVNRDALKKQLCEEHGIKVFYYSNLGIDYPYQVYEDKEELLNAIMSA